MTSPISIREIDHVVLRARDITVMRRFYCEVLGCSVEKEQAGIGLLQLRAGRSLIDLVDVEGPLGRMGGVAAGSAGRNMDHFCVRVDPWDADAIIQHLKAAGVDVGEAVSRYGAEGSGPSIYIADPEGNTVELKGPPEN